MMRLMRAISFRNARRRYAQPVWRDFGGPFAIPRIFHLNRPTYFFFSYEGLRQEKGVTSSTVVPTEQERNGNLSHVQNPIVDPLTDLPFPGNIIPPGRISPAARQILARSLPNAGATPRSLNFTANPSQTIRQNQFILRIDHSTSAKSTSFGRYIYDNTIEVHPFQFGNVPAQFPGFSENSRNRNQNFCVRLQSHHNRGRQRAHGYSAYPKALYTRSAPERFG